MTSFDSNRYRKIAFYYKDLGEKKLLKRSVSNLNIDKRVFLYYSKYSNVPICALPRIKFVLSSRSGFLSFCYNFFTFVNSNENCIIISPSSISSIAKFVISHEVGHILDPDIYKSKEEYTLILSNLIDKLVEYNIDIDTNDFHKGNIPIELESCVIDLKKNLINRESKAWDIAKTIVNFENPKEEFLFNKMKEYALATYNFGNLKNIVKEHHLDIFFKRRQYSA
ncbi:hypothetical protein [Romboutsia lituseburensis]|uniref:hypothetical protein n=1 Tax=Romboutsia lituseburensis TaxID=1537 RepID=UPI00215A5799|nr:hypothetical protein [Romboutsia lituseburensis]MCR8745127.1 hypothetical protein [Romboutsia lituseburensis]